MTPERKSRVTEALEGAPLPKKTRLSCALSLRPSPGLASGPPPGADLPFRGRDRSDLPVGVPPSGWCTRRGSPCRDTPNRSPHGTTHPTQESTSFVNREDPGKVQGSWVGKGRQGTGDPKVPSLSSPCLKRREAPRIRLDKTTT